MPQISVIVSCDSQHVNPGADYMSCFARQTLPFDQFEVIISDNCNRTDFRDAALAIGQQCPSLNIRYVSVDRPGRAAALNCGIALARSPLITLVADDALITPNALAAYLHYHRSNADPLAVAIGPTLFDTRLRADPFRRWLEDSGTLFGVPMRQNFTRWPRRFFFGGNCAFKTSLVDRIGGFNEVFPWITWDDYEFGLRLCAAGGYSQLVTAALAWHEHYVTFGERIAALRTGGHAAVLHEQIGASERPWKGWLDLASRAREQGLDIPADDPALPLPARIPIFEANFNRAFLEGYEAEKRGDRSDLAGLRSST